MMVAFAVPGVIASALGLYWFFVDTNQYITIGVYAALIVQWYSMLVIFKDVRPTKALKQRNQLLCPNCCYPLCEINFDPDLPITCPECGAQTTGQDVLNAWLKIPEYRHAYKKHYR